MTYGIGLAYDLKLRWNIRFHSLCRNNMYYAFIFILNALSFSFVARAAPSDSAGRVSQLSPWSSLSPSSPSSTSEDVRTAAVDTGQGRDGGVGADLNPGVDSGLELEGGGPPYKDAGPPYKEPETESQKEAGAQEGKVSPLDASYTEKAPEPDISKAEPDLKHVKNADGAEGEKAQGSQNVKNMADSLKVKGEGDVRGEKDPKDQKTLDLKNKEAAAEEETDAVQRDYDDEKGFVRKRRGLVLGVSLMGALGQASGYPNEAKTLGNPDFYSVTPVSVGVSPGIFVMGALAEYLNFGFSISVANLFASGWEVGAVGVGFRGEVYPLVKLYPKLRDFGLFSSLGVGAISIEYKKEGYEYPKAEGVQSHFSVGALYEIHVGDFSFAPEVGYEMMTSQSSSIHLFVMGLRIAYYPAR